MRFLRWNLIYYRKTFIQLLESTPVHPFPNDKLFFSSKHNEFSDDNFEFDENGIKLSKWIENTEGKEEIALYEQFHLFPQCFQKTVLQTRANQGLFEKGFTRYLAITF